MEVRKLRQEVIAGLHEMDMRKEPIMIIISLLKTEKQLQKMMDWIATHFEDNPTEDEVIEVAERIKEKVK